MIGPRQRTNQLRAEVNAQLQAISVAAVTLNLRLNAFNKLLGRPRLVARNTPRAKVRAKRKKPFVGHDQ